jgi:hypothetical protein
MAMAYAQKPNVITTMPHNIDAVIATPLPKPSEGP